MDTAIGVFAFIGLVVVALIIACVLTPILLRFLDALIKRLAWILSVSPIAEHIYKVVSKFPYSPSYNADTKKDSVYIPKPIQNFIYSTIRKSGYWQAQIINHLNNRDNRPLNKYTRDMVSQPVENKASHSRANLSRAKGGRQPNANNTLLIDPTPVF
jgi:hypothetical protein